MLRSFLKKGLKKFVRLDGVNVYLKTGLFTWKCVVVAVEGKTLFEAKCPLTSLGGGAVKVCPGVTVVEDKIGRCDDTTTSVFELLP